MNSESRSKQASHDLKPALWPDLSVHSDRIAAADLGSDRADYNSGRIKKTLRL